MESFDASVVFEFGFLFGFYFCTITYRRSLSRICAVFASSVIISGVTFKVDFLLFLIMLELFVIFLLDDCYDCLITTMCI